MSDEQNIAEPPGILKGPAAPPKPFRHLRQASEWLGMSPRQGEYEAAAGRLKVFWIAGHPHVMDEDLLAYVQNRVNQAVADRAIREEKRLTKAKRRAEKNREMDMAPFPPEN